MLKAFVVVFVGLAIVAFVVLCLALGLTELWQILTEDTVVEEVSVTVEGDGWMCSPLDDGQGVVCQYPGRGIDSVTIRWGMDGSALDSP